MSKQEILDRIKGSRDSDEGEKYYIQKVWGLEELGQQVRVYIENEYGVSMGYIVAEQESVKLHIPGMVQEMTTARKRCMNDLFGDVIDK